MTRGAPMRAGTGALLMGLLGLGVSGLVLLASAARTPRAASPDLAPAPEQAAELALAGSTVGRESVSATAPAPGPALDDDAPPGGREDVRGPRKEREFLAGFLALARAQPGALESRAEEILAGPGPTAEKVALLRALEQRGSDEHVRWLERALGLPDEGAGPHGVSLPGYALGALAARARAHADAREALWRAAFQTRALAPELRRGAALGFARGAKEHELGRLEVVLGREDDELLVAGVRAALRDRDASSSDGTAPEPAVER